MQINLAVRNGNNVGRNVRRNVAFLCLNDGESGKRTGTVGIGELTRTLQKTRVQIEDVARICLTSWWTVKCQRHLTVCHRLLGKIVVDDKNVSSGMLLIRGVAVLIVIHKVLTNGSAGHRSNILHRGRICCSSCNDNGLIQNSMACKGFLDCRNRRCLLADSYVNTNHIGLCLIDNGVNCDGGFSRFAVTNDQLSLSASDRNHCINREKTRLNRLIYRLTLHNARSLKLNGTTMCCMDRTQSVNRLTEGVNNAPEHVVVNGNVHDMAGCTTFVSFSNVRDVTKQNGADFSLIQVLREAIYRVTCRRAGKLQQLTGHGGSKTSNASNTVCNLSYDGNLLLINHRIDLRETLTQKLDDRV